MELYFLLNEPIKLRNVYEFLNVKHKQQVTNYSVMVNFAEILKKIYTYGDNLKYEHIRQITSKIITDSFDKTDLCKAMTR